MQAFAIEMKPVILLNLDILTHSFCSDQMQRCFWKKLKQPQRNCLKVIYYWKVLKLGVTVYWKVLKILDDHLNEKDLPKTLSIGSCNQHILHGAFQTAVQTSV